MATEIIKIIDPGGSGDYESLLAADAGLKADYGNLVSLESILRLQCVSSDGSADDAGDVTFALSDWVTDDDYYIILEAIDRCQGVYDTNKYRLTGSILSNTNKIIIDGLAMLCAASYCIAFDNSSPYYSEVKNCFLKSTFAQALILATAAKVKCKNSVAYANGGIRSIVAFGTSTLYVHNVTALGGASVETVIYSSGSALTGPAVTCRNVIAKGGSESCFGKLGNGATLALYNCASSDGSADDYTGSANRVNQTFKFFDETNNDYRIHYKDTAVQGRGIDLRSNADLPVTHDAAGKIRMLPFDIGAFRVSDPEAMFNHDFYNLIANEIGINITHHYDSTTETINVIFHDPYATSGSEIQVESQDPRLWVKAWQADNITRSSYFTIMGSTYYIREIKSEYHGLIEIVITQDNQK